MTQIDWDALHAQAKSIMAKAYWIAVYRSIKNPDALVAYAQLAGPAIQA